MGEYDCTCGEGDDDDLTCPDCDRVAAFHLRGCTNAKHVGCPAYKWDITVRSRKV